MKSRSLIKMFLLFLVTLGIYRIYWLLKTRKEMIKAHPGIKIASPILLILPYLLLASALITFVAVGIHQAVQDRDAGCITGSTSETSTSPGTFVISAHRTDICASNIPPAVVVLFYIACAAFLPLLAIWMWTYCKAVDRLTEEKFTFAMAMLVLLVVPDGFDMLIVQDAFNKLADKTAAPTAPVQPLAPAASA